MSRGRLFLLALLLAVSGAVVHSTAGPVLPGTTTLASRATHGRSAAGASYPSSVSSDGRFVAFASTAGDLTAGDANGTWDVFVLDRDSGALELISTTAEGQAADAPSFWPVLSDDGRWVAFLSRAGDLRAGSGGNYVNVYLVDRASHEMTNLSDTHEIRTRQRYVEEDGTVRGGAVYPSISGDGRTVAFTANPCWSWIIACYSEIYVYDGATATTERILIDRQYYAYPFADLSGDGSTIIFASPDRDLVEGDTNGIPDVFALERSTGTIERISIDSLERQAGGGREPLGSTYGLPSRDGNRVAFVSHSPTLVNNEDYPDTSDVFLRDRQAGSTVAISAMCGGLAPLGHSSSPAVSHDGRWVAFWSDADGIVRSDRDGSGDVFLHDTATRFTQELAVDDEGSPAAEVAGDVLDVSATGRTISFASLGSTLASGDDNGDWDVFVRDVAGSFSTQPPMLVDPGEHQGYLGREVRVVLRSCDPNGGRPTYSSGELPPGARLTQDGIFTWTPSIGQSGKWLIPVRVSDPSRNVDEGLLTIRVATIASSVLCVVLPCSSGAASTHAPTPCPSPLAVDAIPIHRTGCALPLSLPPGR